MADQNPGELKLLREQMTHDLTMTWKVMGDMDDRLQILAREMSEGFRQCQGRLRLVKQRLGTFLEVVERDIAGKAERSELLELADRVRLLEDRLSA